jgi:hypothetical protein
VYNADNCMWQERQEGLGKDTMVRERGEEGGSSAMRMMAGGGVSGVVVIMCCLTRSDG